MRQPAIGLGYLGGQPALVAPAGWRASAVADGWRAALIIATWLTAVAGAVASASAWAAARHRVTARRGSACCSALVLVGRLRAAARCSSARAHLGWYLRGDAQPRLPQQRARRGGARRPLPAVHPLPASTADRA
jgi:hypothetical protein